MICRPLPDEPFTPGDWALYECRSWLVEFVDGDDAVISDNHGEEKRVPVAQLDRVVT